MNLHGVVTKLSNGEIHYALGRFRVVRAAYGGMRRLLDGPVLARHAGRSVLFPTADVSQIVQTIAEEAVFVGLNLPPATVAEILAFARAEPIHANYDPNGPTFRYADVRRGRTPDGRSVSIGGIHDPCSCPAVQRVVDDPVLRAIVTGYLGHEPRQIMTILHWSFASDFTDDERRRLQHYVIDYHYDVSGFNFVYASFYLTDTDRHSGAHVMMKRSHKKKAAAHASWLCFRKRGCRAATIWHRQRDNHRRPGGNGLRPGHIVLPSCHAADPPRPADACCSIHQLNREGHRPPLDERRHSAPA